MGDRLKDKVALVSGAGSSGPGWGNGKATAVLFAREGAKVFAVDINRDAALETKRIIDGEGGICEAVSADVSRANDVAAMISACITAFGRIDVLHNNVGIVEVGGPVETTEESWDRVNLLRLSRRTPPHYAPAADSSLRPARSRTHRARPWDRKSDCPVRATPRPLDRATSTARKCFVLKLER
jgi:NAD(P)-dependent dehydrogenase (short-subunit alcohol dehydrogenase family)